MWQRRVWRWAALAAGRAGPVVRPRLMLDAAPRERLVFWWGNVTAVHRELVDAAAAGGPPASGVTSLRRAVREALSPGERAGLRKGERAAREHDVFLRLSWSGPLPAEQVELVSRGPGCVDAGGRPG